MADIESTSLLRNIMVSSYSCKQNYKLTCRCSRHQVSMEATTKLTTSQRHPLVTHWARFPELLPWYFTEK